MFGPIQLTVFEHPGVMLHSQFGFVTFLEWCRKEKARINAGGGMRAEVIFGDGQFDGFCAIAVTYD